MKKITQQEFDALPVVEGRKKCPGSTDYSAIKHFPDGCIFGERCSFGAWCSFGAGLSFGKRCSFCAGCSFGERCSFDAWCSFGEGLSFGERCIFGEVCSFCAGCSFGERCSFCAGCSFGEGLSFGEGCNFGKRCSFEYRKARTSNPYIAIDRAGSACRKTYFFDFEDGIYVRSGCFFGSLSEFRAKVLEDEDGDASTVKAMQYLGMANIAAVTFGRRELIDWGTCK